MSIDPVSTVAGITLAGVWLGATWLDRLEQARRYSRVIGLLQARRMRRIA